MLTVKPGSKMFSVESRVILAAGGREDVIEEHTQSVLWALKVVFTLESKLPRNHCTSL